MPARCDAGKKRYPHLFEPIRIGNLKMKNRIFAAPTSPSMMTPEGHMTPEMAAYLEEKHWAAQQSLLTARQLYTPQPGDPTTSSCSWIPSV